MLKFPKMSWVRCPIHQKHVEFISILIDVLIMLSDTFTLKHSQ